MMAQCAAPQREARLWLLHIIATGVLAKLFDELQFDRSIAFTWGDRNIRGHPFQVDSMGGPFGPV